MAIIIPNELIRNPNTPRWLRDLWKSVGEDSENTPSADEKAALTGTTTPSAASPFVNDDDTRLPTADQKAALAGTNGTPSAANKYVTDSDPRVATAIVSSGELTLDNGGGTTTTIADTAVTATCRIIVWATSANAAAAVGTAAGVYTSAKNVGVSFVITHPAMPGAGATMDYVIVD